MQETSGKTDGESRAILIIDDEESLRLTFQLFLQRQGYGPVMTASSFEEALTVISENHFDLIISDIVLEGTSGIDLLRRIREMGVDCPVVMVTGYPNVETASEAVRLGAFDYISKPVDKDTLLKTARLALRQYHLEREKLRAEKENQQYRTFLETIFRSVSDGIIIVDRDLNVIKMNEAGRKLFQELDPEVTEGANLRNICQADALCSLRTDPEKVLRTGSEITEHRIECKTAENATKVLSVCMSPLDDGHGGFKGVVIVIRDMSRDRPRRPGRRSRFHRFIGQSDAMQTVYTMIENVGKVDTTVLITGESGTGKELAAEALHEESHRRNRPLVKVDCTAIPENLLESELFGHRKGAFTGADRDRMGRILQADGGTLFLDEIGDISTMMQLRLLRFLQEKTFYPVGRDTPIQVDVRVITATNVDLKKKVEAGQFREDLYFRLRVIDVILPALREREGDIPLLVHHFIGRIAEKLGKKITGISDQALLVLERYPWPGNVRELEHVLERACVLCEGPTISTNHLPPEIVNYQATEQAAATHQVMAQPVPDVTPAASPGLQAPLPMEERILNALRKTGGNKAKAARLLNIDRSTLYRKIKEMNIDLSVLDI
ncbi:MAG TPA: sigma-54-dependent Fis family transcriptional regulator [Desulfobulbus sp.]|nr:sigma-54-dependent Fis family transcriptional regulator [Desulfobulbus sp.]